MWAKGLARRRRRLKAEFSGGQSKSGGEVDLRYYFSENELAARYTAALQAAEVDLGVGELLSLAELREILPEAPVGHRIRILKYLRGARSRPEEAKLQLLESFPDDVSWRGLRQFLGSGDARETTKENIDIMVVVASLVASIGVSALLAPLSCHDTVADEDAVADSAWCSRIRSADLIAWMATVSLLMLCVLTSTVVTACMRLVPDSELVRWLILHWHVVQLPLQLFIVGVHAFSLAISLRMWQVAERTTATILSVMAALVPVGFHVTWHPALWSTLGISYRDGWAANSGFCFGMQNPSREAWREAHLRDGRG